MSKKQLTFLGILFLSIILFSFGTFFLYRRNDATPIPESKPANENMQTYENETGLYDSKMGVGFRIPDQLIREPTPGYIEGQWTYVTKDRSVEVSVLAIPHGVDYAKNAYHTVQFTQYTNGVIRGQKSTGETNTVIYIFDHPKGGYLWVKGSISPEAERQAALGMIEELAQSVVME